VAAASSRWFSGRRSESGLPWSDTTRAQERPLHLGGTRAPRAFSAADLDVAYGRDALTSAVPPFSAF
jgi:hypothetical protein